MKKLTTFFKHMGFMALAIILTAPHSVLAVVVGGTSAGGGTTVGGTPSSAESSEGLTNPLNGINSLPEFIDKLLVAVVQIGSMVLLFALIYVGFKFVTAQGNEEEIRSARSALMWTVIGGLVLLGAQTIGLVISTTVNSLK